MNWQDSVRLDLEDRTFLEALPVLPVAFKSFSRPDEISVAWHKTENQGPIGSCQGNGLSSILERLQYVIGSSVQLSRIFAYLATQKIDGLLGSDQGSTISGGAKLALETGVPLESLTGYPARYPGASDRNQILSSANYAAAAAYKALSKTKISSHEEALNLIGGGGGISLGISWYSGLIPADRIVRSFNPPGRAGGHAMAQLGYRKNGNIIGVNSHADGPYEITPEAFEQMLRHQWTACIGLMGNAEAKPVDWYNESYFV